MREITIAGRKVGDGHPPFLIAEAGLNHAGSLERALQMVAIAKLAGCDVVKFQTYRAAEFCRPDDPMFATFKRCELEPDTWPVIKAECERLSIIFMSTPQNRSDLDILLKVGIPAIKVGSDDFCNLPLIEDYASEGLPLILSCGMAEWKDVDETLKVVDASNIALLLCTSQYPCPPEEARLDRLRRLRMWYDVPIGLSDHTKGLIAGIMAVALKACIFEKHFRLRDAEAPEDFAEFPNDLAHWAASIRSAYSMMGEPSINLTELEKFSRSKYQRQPGQQIRGLNV